MIRYRALPTLGLLSLLIFSFGCQENGPSEPTFTVRDSAGIEIVESSDPLLGPDAWTISEEPVLQIGEVEGDDPYLFAGIPLWRNETWGGVFRWSDGRIVVANRLDRSIRVFDEGGTFLFEFGRAGEGPGEFDSPPRACVRHGEGIAVLESYRVTFFDGEGRFLGRVDSQLRTPVHGVFPDWAVLSVKLASDPSLILDPPPGVHTKRGTVSVHTPDGTISEWVDTISIDRTFVLREGAVVTNSAQPFGPRSILLVAGEEVVYGWGDEYQIVMFDREGDRKTIIRRRGDPIPVTDEDMEGYRRLLLDGRDSPEFRTFAEALIFPDHKTAFDRILLDSQGQFWVRTPAAISELATLESPSPHWDVFDPSGQWVTTMKLPSDLQVHDIGKDYILGVWKDELEVEYVRMYSLAR